ncbi:MAG TPA: type II toxin-antitoxin system RelE/ParE family toxin [Sulfurovum sp.]|nr:type II toxin-antitoxin system RelE/ParE family toxin [Sulfurovum sp.]
MHNLKFKPEVYNDIKIAYDWYESQRIGLGEDFLLTLEESYAKIARTPKVYQLIYKTVRRKLVRRFPYGVFFVLRDDEVIVVAIMHTRREPSDWNERV